MSGDGLVLVPFAPAHFATLASWFVSDREVVQWGGPAVHYPLDPKQMQAMLPDEATPRSHLAWMARRDDVWVGHAQVVAFDVSAGMARLGRIAVAPTQRGRGLAVPVLRLVIDEVVAISAVVRIDLGVYTSNVGAIKTYQRLGFAPSAVQRASAIVHGEHWEAQEMSLLRSSSS